MRNIFALVGAGTVTFVGLGWYLDWYHLSRQPAATGTQSFQVDLNPDKITQDVKKGVERGGEIIDRIREDKGTPEQPAPAQAQQSNGVASQFFSPPPAAKPPQAQTTPGGNWKSLDTLPPPPPVYQPVGASAPQR
jgi:hypothetical protein